MATCQGTSAIHPNACCCKHCAQRRVKSPICCSCVPRIVCFIWYGPNEYSPPERWTFVYDEANNGEYLGINQVLPGVPPNTYNLQLDIVKTDDGDCAWLLRGADDGNFETNADQSHTELMENPNVGCLTEEGSYFQVDNWYYGTQAGTVIIKAFDYEFTPLVDNGNGAELLCDCTCFPSCLCINYAWQEGYTDPQYGWRTVIQADRVAWVCWDPDLEENGAWKWYFEGIEDNTECAYPIELTLELNRLPDGSCGLILTDSKDEFIDESPLGDNFTCSGGDITALWIKQIDATHRRQVFVQTNGCAETCLVRCCQFYPEKLTGVISNPDGHIATRQFDLFRQDCAKPIYTATGVEVDWDCTSNDTANGKGTGKFDIEIECRGCKWSYVDLICKCDCDDTLPFGDTGCWLVNSFTTYDFICIPDLPTCAGDPGNQTNEVAKCDPANPSSCDPVIQHWGIGVQGSNDCLDNFQLVVTE